MAAGGSQADFTTAAALPRVIWMLWLQGWHQAPELVRACAETWRRRNPGWTVRRLDRAHR
jgi:mannosyltransferase OCH1-like enzyme